MAKQPLKRQEVIVSGNEAVVDEENKTYEIKPMDIQQVNAWRDGRLIFQSTPLMDVIDEVNRYIENKIVIGDQSLEDVTKSLDFKIKDRNEFISTLDIVIPIVSQRTSDGQVVIFRRENA
ncbi:MAG: hypothetical protein JRH15_14325 [Deltaproteobacteria bacterium]|nr:hypothetical protein [Deltaproteobacteria bacterium]